MSAGGVTAAPRDPCFFGDDGVRMLFGWDDFSGTNDR